MYSTSLVRALVLHFADLAGWDGDRYLVTLSRRTFDRAARRWTSDRSEDDDYGATLVHHGPDPERFPVTWVNISNNTTMARLVRTCAHEALHSARPQMRHGRAFDKAVTRLTRNIEP